MYHFIFELTIVISLNRYWQIKCGTDINYVNSIRSNNYGKMQQDWWKSTSDHIWHTVTRYFTYRIRSIKLIVLFCPCRTGSIISNTLTTIAKEVKEMSDGQEEAAPLPILLINAGKHFVVFLPVKFAILNLN